MAGPKSGQVRRVPESKSDANVIPVTSTFPYPSMSVAVIQKAQFCRVSVTRWHGRAISKHGVRPSARMHSSSQPYSTSSSSSVPGGSQDPFSYCRDFVKKHDMDSYLISQFFPRSLQAACFAVRAFYVCRSSSAVMYGFRRLIFIR